MAAPELDTCLFKAYPGYSSPHQWLPDSPRPWDLCRHAPPPPPAARPRTCSGFMRHLEVKQWAHRGKPTTAYFQGTPFSLECMIPLRPEASPWTGPPRCPHRAPAFCPRHRDGSGVKKPANHPTQLPQRFLETLEPREETQEDGAPPSHMRRAWRAAPGSPSTSGTVIVASATPTVLFWLELPGPRLSSACSLQKSSS